MAKKEKKSKKKRQAKEAKSLKIEASSSPTRELELFKSELASLVCTYESLANKYDHVIKSFSHRSKVEEEANDVLEVQLAKLTSARMALHADHKGLECSYEKLVDSYATLEIAHEVVLSIVNPCNLYLTHAHAHKFKLIYLVLMIMSLKQANLALSMYL
jgi:hypothetical protein